MRAITVNEYGAAPALTNVPDPRPGPGQILIKVGAAGVNPMDRSMAAGAWKEIACELMVLGETVDYTAVSVLDFVGQTHPDGIDVLVDLASDSNGFASLAALVRPGGTALSTRYVADTEVLASREVTGVNFRVGMSSEALERLANLVVSRRIVLPPIALIRLDDVPTRYGTPHADGKILITPERPW